MVERDGMLACSSLLSWRWWSFYESCTAERFFTEITTEAEARALLWRSRFQDNKFQYPFCHA